MTFTHARYWLLASAFIVVLAATLLMIAVPAEAAAPLCYAIPDDNNNCKATLQGYCHDLRSLCGEDPPYQVFKHGAHGVWKQLCGPSYCATPTN